MLPAPSASADVRLTIANGKVSLSAKDATVRQILAEWSRIGQTKIVNADRIVGSQVTLELADVSEEQALDVILRSVSGYLAAPRSVAVANASRYDRILVLATSTGTRPAPAPAQAVYQPPPFNPQQADDLDEPEEFPGQPGAPGAPGAFGAPRNGDVPMPRGPIFNAFPPGGQRYPATAQPNGAMPPQEQEQPQPQSPGAFPTPGMSPGVTMSPGVAVPGMVVPGPPQPGAPGTPQETP
jgi:hypothetical protein